LPLVVPNLTNEKKYTGNVFVLMNKARDYYNCSGNVINVFIYISWHGLQKTVRHNDGTIN